MTTDAEHLAVYAASEAWARAHLAAEHPVTRLAVAHLGYVAGHAAIDHHDDQDGEQ